MKECVRENSVETGKFMELERRGRGVVSSRKPGRNRNGARNVNTLSVLLEVEDLSHLWVDRREGKEFFGTAPWVPQNCFTLRS